MHRSSRHAGRAAALAASLLAATLTGPRPALADRATEARALYDQALDYEAQGTIPSRRLAMQALEKATTLAPDSVDYQLVLGRIYYRMGFLKQARKRFQMVERRDPQNPDARFGIGQYWRRDWLKYLDRESLSRSIEQFGASARLRPGEPEAWLQLVPLLYERKDFPGAAQAAEQALAAAPYLPDAQLAVAYTSYRLGRVERAESTFVVALRRLHMLARERFEDIAPVASEQDTATLRELEPAARPEFIRRFWRDLDPDLTSPENEAQLEYWARVAQAYFLYFNPQLRQWDERGEMYVRFGAPERADYNPVGWPSVQGFSTGTTFQLNTLVWHYPSLGMMVVMHDRLLSEQYLRPIHSYEDLDPHPDPMLLALRSDLFPSRSGRGVFPVLPPRAEPRPVGAVVVRFAGEHGPRLFGEVETPGAPDEVLSAEWVVLDSTMTEVARARREAGVSACDPGSLRSADFAAELPPGRYQVGLTVRDGAGRRGVVRTEVELDAAPATLSLSDAVVTCGRPTVTDGSVEAPASLSIDASVAGEVNDGGPLNVYFEMYDLRPDETGTARFEYEATVVSGERDRRIWIQRLLAPRPKIPAISASRREEQPGNLRRQIVSIPIGELAEGRYRLQIRVRDLNAGSEATTQVAFVKRGHVGG